MSNFVNLLDIVYPVGSIYQSMDEKSPVDFIGGTWTKIKTFLYGADTAKETGGEATHTLSLNEMPAHSHNGSTGGAGNHNHSIDGRIIAWYGPGGGNVLQGAGNYFGSVGSYGGQYTSNSGDHTHTIVSNGGGQAHNNMPPYTTCFIWYRTA